MDRINLSTRISTRRCYNATKITCHIHGIDQVRSTTTLLCSPILLGMRWDRAGIGGYSNKNGNEN